MKNALKQQSAAKRLRLAMAACYLITVIPHAGADLTELSNVPLANMAGTVAVKPNVMFILDDSGSMQWDYMPDFVNDSNTSLTPKYTGVVGDPPYMSPYYNKQYYNPEIVYSPGVAYDGSTTHGSLSLISQSRGNTAGWTSVRTDPYNKQNLDQRGSGTNYTNLVTGYPDRVYCISSSSDVNSTTDCRTNSSGFYYAHGYSSPATDPYSVGLDGSNKVKYRFGAPYYYNILPWEYCTDDALTNCVMVTPGSSAPSGYPYPSRMRWCTSAANANARTPATGSCQARRIGSFTNPRFGGLAPAVASFGFLTVGNSGNDLSVSINEVRVNGVNIIGAAVTSSTGTNSSTERSTVATAIANAINSFNSSPEYIACAGTGCNSAPYSTFGLGTVAADTVAIIAVTTSGGTTPVTDGSRAGYAITVTAPTTTQITTYSSTPAFTVSSSGTGSGKVTSIKAGPAGGPNYEVSGSVSITTTTDNSTNRQAAGKKICDAINSYSSSGAGAPWEYWGRTNTTKLSKSCSNSTTFYVDAEAGAAANGYQITLTTTGLTITPLSATFSGGVTTTAAIPTTSTAFSAGLAAGSSPFQRVDIVSTRTSYPKAATRTDCTSVAGACSYDEEMTNFANWYAYYRTRNQMMKSAASRAFLPLGEKYRLGFNTINNGTFNNLAAGGTNWLPVADLTPTQKQNWYTKLFAAGGSSSTPLRSALTNMGKYYEGTLSGANSPIQYSCQQNFTILSSDGFWNSDTTFALPGSGDYDDVDDPSLFCTRSNGCFDGNLGYINTLSDVAAYYYRRDLRTDLEDNVPISDTDSNPAQHMTTYTLSLGIDGNVVYRSDYDTASTGDYYRIRTGDSGCPWAAGTCNWPQPVADALSAVDDLWHAAVAGHGKYFSAKDPASLASGLSAALNSLQSRVGAAAASATSTPNVTQEDNFEFSSTFRTVKWDGELVAQNIDVTTGATLSSVLWSARGQLQNKVDETSDTRTIYSIGSAINSRKTFTWDAMSSTERAWFASKCAGAGVWTQCLTLTSDQKDVANNGENLVNYLRGQRVMEHYQESPVDDPVAIYRKRDFVLGDIAGSKPAYVAAPVRKYADSGYSDFITAQKSRAPMVYAGGNDGMLHAFSAEDGSEQWAYVPRMVMPDLYWLANSTYGTDHRYYVDGSPVVGDIKSGSDWKTILVSGLNHGGRGYYAIDITDPANPRPLWEICHDSTLCLRSDPDIGYSYGEPIITKRPSDGKWVVIITSGYNNVSPGDGEGHIFVLDPLTGQVLSKYDNNYGTTASPSGLAKISDFVEDANTDATSSLVFGGDLYGNVWRVDLATGTVTKLAVLTNSSGGVLPITARPETGKCSATPMVYIGTGRYLGAADVSDTGIQTMWGIVDSASALGTLRSGGKMIEQSLSTTTGGYALTNNAVDVTKDYGWFVDFDITPGERITLDPALVNGNLLALTTIPFATGSAACGTGGRSNMYQFNYCSGAAFNPLTPAGKLVSDSVVVGFTVVGLPSGARVKITKADGTKDVQQAEQGTGVGLSTSRIGWRELTE